MNTELEQRLRAGMDRATQDVHVPPGLALKAYRHHRKATMTARAVTAAGAAAALAAGTLTVAGVSGAFGRSAGGQIRTDAYVISRVERALSARDMNNMIGHTRTVLPAGVTLQPVPGGVNGTGQPAGSSPQDAGYEVVWAYHRTSKLSAFGGTGQRLFDERIAVRNGSVATTVVNYTSHTWWTAQSARPAVAGPSSASCLPRGQIRLGGGGDAWPVFIRSQLACGAYTVAGKRAVDGVKALEIRGSGGYITLWVNPATYLPIRLKTRGIQIDFQWLPATPAHLAMLNTPVPSGFHQVSPPS